jgi:ketosteroid isomerase-like protein
MDEHPNATILRQGYDAFGRGDMDGVARILADDVLWHSPGHSPLSGDYTGIPAVLGLLGEIAQRTGGTFRADVHDILANDVHGVALVTISGSRGGKTVTDRQVHVVHFRDGKLAESWFTGTDQDAVDELFV